MKRLDFTKANGEVADMPSVHAWLDRAVRYATNGNYSVTVARVVRRRSLSQNRLMWMWFACISQETGQPSQDVHDYYCIRYLRREVCDLRTGAMVAVPGHTSTLSVEAFTVFLDQVQADAATELGITLPTPDDLAWEEFEQQFKEYAR